MTSTIPLMINLKPEINPYLEIFSETGDLLLSEPKLQKSIIDNELKKSLYVLHHGTPFKLATDPTELKELKIKANLLKRPNSPNKVDYINYNDTPQIINRKKINKKLQKYNGVFVVPSVHAKKKIYSLIDEWKDKVSSPRKTPIQNSFSSNSFDNNMQVLSKVEIDDTNYINIENEISIESLKNNNSKNNQSQISYSSSIFRNIRSAPLLASLQEPKIGSAKSPMSSLSKTNIFNDNSVDRDIIIALKGLTIKTNSCSSNNSTVEESADEKKIKLVKLRAIQDQNNNELMTSFQSNILENNNTNKNKKDKKLKSINKKSIRKESPPKKGSAMEYALKQKQLKEKQQHNDKTHINSRNKHLNTTSIHSESINDNVSGFNSSRYELELVNQNNDIELFKVTNNDKNNLSKNGRNNSTKNISIITKDKMINCVICCKEAKLWCNHCTMGYCYLCWGLIDHHRQSDAHQVYSKLHNFIVHQGLRPSSPQLSSPKTKLNSESNLFETNYAIKSSNKNEVRKYANKEWADFENATTYMHAHELKNLKESIKEFDIK